MEESDSLLKVPVKTLTSSNGDKKNQDEEYEAEKVPNVKHESDDEDDKIVMGDTEEHSVTIPIEGSDNADTPTSNVLPESTLANGMGDNTTYESRTSLGSTVNADVCRICHCESEPGAPLISPCVCCGSLKYVHQACLQQWIKSADTKSCELCKFDFSMTTKIKPFRKWQKLDMTTVERRKIMCSVTFHIIAITCVIWSLYVLIEKTTQEIRNGVLEWPFWTKLIVVAIGFTGGLVFMYVQCKMYVQLCRRWRAYNRVIYIQDVPEGNQKVTIQPVYTQTKLQSGNNQTSLFPDTNLL